MASLSHSTSQGRKAPDPLVKPVQQPNSGAQGLESASPGKRLPNERDESVDSQDSAPRRVIEQARRDVEGGLTDTDRGTPMDSLYKHTAGTSGDPPNRGDEVSVPGTGRPAASEWPEATHDRNPLHAARHQQERGLDKAEGQGEQAHVNRREHEGYGQAGNLPQGAARSGGSRSQGGSSYGDFKPERGAFGERQHGGHLGDYYAGGSDHRGAGGQRGHDEFEADYHRWRQEQVQQIDEDYRLWRRDNAAFSDEFPRWREARMARPGEEGGGAAQPQGQQPDSDEDALANSGSQTSLGYGGTGQERDSRGSTSGGAADGTSGAAPDDGDALRGGRSGGPSSNAH